MTTSASSAPALTLASLGSSPLKPLFLVDDGGQRSLVSALCCHAPDDTKHPLQDPIKHLGCTAPAGREKMFCAHCRTAADGACPFCLVKLTNENTMQVDSIIGNMARMLGGHCSYCSAKMQFAEFASHMSSSCASPCRYKCGQQVLLCDVAKHKAVCTQMNLPCTNKAKGCLFRGDKASVLKHGRDSCEWRVISCPGCHARCQGVDQFKRHRDSTCMEVMLACSHAGCTVKVKRADHAAHQQVCEWRLVACKGAAFQCRETILSRDLAAHETQCGSAQLKIQLDSLATRDQERDLQIQALQAEIQRLRKQPQASSRADVADAVVTSPEPSTGLKRKGAVTDPGDQGHVPKKPKPPEFLLCWVAKQEHGESRVVRSEDSSIKAISVNWIWRRRIQSAFSPTSLKHADELPPGLLVDPCVRGHPATRKGVLFGTVEFLDHLLEYIPRGHSPFSTYSILNATVADVLLAKKLLSDHGDDPELQHLIKMEDDGETQECADSVKPTAQKNAQDDAFFTPILQSHRVCVYRIEGALWVNVVEDPLRRTLCNDNRRLQDGLRNELCRTDSRTGRINLVSEQLLREMSGPDREACFKRRFFHHPKDDQLMTSIINKHLTIINQAKRKL